MGDDLFRKLALGTNLRKPTAGHARAGANNRKSARTTSSKHPQQSALATTTDIHCYRKKYKIRVKGEGVPAPIKKFSQLAAATASSPHTVDDKLLKALKKTGIKRPTPVQKQAIPVLLAGRDAIVVAPTGTGKTLSFLLPMFALLGKPASGAGIQALIAAPTRELADQICREARKLSAAVSVQYLDKSLFNRWKAKAPVRWPQVLICTPLRLVQAAEDKVLSLGQVRMVVLDEVDRLLDKNFLEQMDRLFGCFASGQSIQKIVFSATIPSGIEDLAQQLMVDPVRVSVGRASSDISARIDQSLVYVGREDCKLLSIRQMINTGITPPVIVFCNSIDACVGLCDYLQQMGVPVDTIHSGRSQSERDQAVRSFRDGHTWILITTDLLSRGLDFPNVANVINYDYPESTASYIHRIGRTGRAGRRGKAITFYSDSDVPHIRVVVNVMKESGCAVPEWLRGLRKSK